MLEPAMLFKKLRGQVCQGRKHAGESHYDSRRTGVTVSIAISCSAVQVYLVNAHQERCTWQRGDLKEVWPGWSAEVPHINELFDHSAMVDWRIDVNRVPAGPSDPMGWECCR